MRLFKVLKKKPYCNDTHLILIPILIILFTIKYWYFIFVLILYLVFIIRKTKLLIPILVLIAIIIGRISIQNIIVKNIDLSKIEGIVEDVDEDKYIIKTKSIKILAYDYSHNYKPGDRIEAVLEVYDIDDKSYESDFDYLEYLKSKGISYQVKVLESKLIKKGFSLNSIKYYYLKYLKNILSEPSYQYVSALIFGDNLLDDEIKDSYSALGISHILAVSGMHIILLYNFLSLILLKLFKYYKSNIQLIIISIFVLLISAPSSCVRALLFLLIGHFNNFGENKYTKLDILSLACIIMLLYNPHQIHQAGFKLTYLVSFILIFSKEFFDSNKKLSYSYKIYMLIFISTIPILINMNNKIELGSLLLAPILSGAVCYIVMPVAFIISIFPIMDYFFKYVFELLNTYLVSLSNIMPSINIRSFSLIITIIYYLLLVIVIKALAIKKRRIISISFLTLYIFLINSLSYINPMATVTFIDGGQGDSSLIQLPNNKGVMLIDAYNSFDYLKSLGLSKIDYLVLSHSDSDHTGDYLKILDYFEVEYILYPRYDLFFEELLLDYENKYPIDCNSKINFKSVNIEVLGPIKDYGNSNDNSLVLKIMIQRVSILYCGDISTQQEYELIEKYGKILDCDILKVAHHGSITSSSLEFINVVSPKYSIISAGKNNKYGHPNIEIVNRLSHISIVYKTYITGNITFSILNSNLSVSTYR